MAEGRERITVEREKLASVLFVDYESSLGREQRLEGLEGVRSFCMYSCVHIRLELKHLDGMKACLLG